MRELARDVVTVVATVGACDAFENRLLLPLLRKLSSCCWSTERAVEELAEGASDGDRVLERGCGSESVSFEASISIPSIVAVSDLSCSRFGDGVGMGGGASVGGVTGAPMLGSR